MSIWKNIFIQKFLNKKNNGIDPQFDIDIIKIFPVVIIN